MTSVGGRLITRDSTESRTALVTGNVRGTVSGVLHTLSYCFEENPFRFLLLTKHKKCSIPEQPTVNVKKCRATILIMTTGIISFVLLVLMAIVMYFVMKIYSVLRPIECDLHEAGIEVTGRKIAQTGAVHQQTPVWRVENTGRVPEEHDERQIQVSQLFYFERKLTKEHPNTLNSISFLSLGYHGCKVNKTKKKKSIKFYLHTVNIGDTFIGALNSEFRCL